MKHSRFWGAAGYLAALLPLWALGFVRFLGALSGVLDGVQTRSFCVILGAIGVLLGIVCLLFWFILVTKRSIFSPLFHPFTHPVTNRLFGGGMVVLGAWLDMSHRMVSVPLPGGSALRMLCHLGSGVALAALALALCAAVKACGRVETGSLWQMPLLFLLVNALALFYLVGSATVYVWDNAGYWTVARQLAQSPHPIGQLREVAATTLTLDYNQLLAWPISLVMRVFGGSRAVFVLAIVDLYLLPALWGLCALGARGRAPGAGRHGRWGGIQLMLLFPALIYLALVGYVDVAPCAVCIWAVVHYLRRDSPWWARGLLCGTLLILALLLRRYFLFFALSFGGAALVRAIVLRTREEWRAFGALFATCAGVGLFAAQPFLLDKLTTRYGSLYAAYALGLRSDILLFCRYFGAAVLVLALALALYRALRRPALLAQLLPALTQLALCFLLLTRVQSHGQQHTLLYLPALALLLAPGEEEGEGLDDRVGAAAWLLGIACTLLPLVPREQPTSLTDISHPDLLPGFSFHGPRRSDIGQLLALSDYLDELTGGQKSVAVCASSFLLNNETLPHLRPSLGLAEPADAARYVYVCDVDKRDPFSWALLQADYLVVGEPVQVHLGEDNQQLIALVAHAVLDGTGLGGAYQKMPRSFTLQDGASVWVYQRIREVTPAERESLALALQQRYPDYAALYQAP